MTRDFTFEIYRELLEAGLDAGYEHITVRDYLTRETLPEQFIIHRHDVDRKPENALEMARVEAEYDIPTTYYFRTIDKTFDPEMIAEIEQHGHEIGYHYEDMDRADGDIERAEKLFSANLEKLRNHATINTICMHGNPLTAHDNRDLWKGKEKFDQFDIVGEAYLSMDFEDVTYFSDTGRTWKDGALKIKDHTMGEGDKNTMANTTQDLIELLGRQNPQRLCILSHPNRWATNFGEYLVEYSKDTVTNVGKRGLNVFRG